MDSPPPTTLQRLSPEVKEHRLIHSNGALWVIEDISGLVCPCLTPPSHWWEERRGEKRGERGKGGGIKARASITSAYLFLTLQMFMIELVLCSLSYVMNSVIPPNLNLC